MIKVIKTIAIAFLIIGVIGFSINLIYGAQVISFIQQEEKIWGDTTITYYRLDMWSYITNIKTATQDTAVLSLNANVGGFYSVDFDSWPSDLDHNMRVSMNIFILMINVLIYPIRLGGYMAKTFMTVIGVSFTDYPTSIEWLINLINGVITMEIPMIPY